MKNETRFFTFKYTLERGVVRDYPVWVYRGTEGTFIQGSKSVDFSPSIHILYSMMHDSTFIEISFDTFKERFKDSPQVRMRFPYVFKDFEPEPEPKVVEKVKAKPTIFGIKPFKGTVIINKSISGPRIVAHREHHCRTKFFDKMSFPYHLAVYLRLMPDGSGLQFTNQFYDLTNEEVDGLVANGSDITSVKRTKNGVIVSLNIS